MKFVYVDESGDEGQGDVFVMAGLLVDAYRLRKHTERFDEMISEFLGKHPGLRKELKTRRMIDGEGGWSAVNPDERKKFLGDVCDLAHECARTFAVAFSFENFSVAAAGPHNQPFGKSYWLGAAMFTAALIQQKMQKGKKNKGLTVLICDDNKQGMQNLSDALHDADPWFDPLYATSRSKGGKTVWNEVAEDKRFDQIVNTAFVTGGAFPRKVGGKNRTVTAGRRPWWPRMAGLQPLSTRAFGPRLRRLTALTALATRPLIATKRSTVRCGQSVCKCHAEKFRSAIFARILTAVHSLRDQITALISGSGSRRGRICLPPPT